MLIFYTQLYVFIVWKPTRHQIKQLTEEEQTKTKSRKVAGLDEIPPKIWKTRKYDELLLRFSNAIYKQNTTEKWTKGCPHPKKGNLGITKIYRSITLVANVCNTLHLSCIKPEIEKILRKNQNSFGRNRSTISQILTIRRIIKGVRHEATLLFVDFSKAFNSIHRREMVQIFLANDLLKEIVTAIMKLYKTRKQ